MQGNLIRGVELALVLISICAVRADTSGDMLPPDHGLSNEENPDDPSPAMAAFFGARPAAPIPLASNRTDPIWGVEGKVSPASPPSDGIRRRTVLLAAGVACGVVGLGLLAAAAAYTVRFRANAQPTGSPDGIGPGSTRGKKGRQVRLGSPA